MSKHVLITGGMGFIGHHLVKAYLYNKCKVTVVDNLFMHTNHPKLTKYRIESIDSCVTSKSQFNFMQKSCIYANAMNVEIPHPVDTIVHLASYANQAAVARDSLSACSSMTSDTYAMSNMARILNARLVYVSSSMAYGDWTKLKMSEDEPLKPTNLYGMLKAQGEDIAKLIHKNTVIVRPSAVYGPGDNLNRVLAKWIHAARNDRSIDVNKPSSLLDFTYVEDLAQGIIAIESNGKAGEAYNLTFGEARSLGEASMLIKHLTNSKSYISVGTQETNEPVRGSLDISKAMNIGYNPKIDLTTGLLRYIDWFNKYDHVY